MLRNDGHTPKSIATFEYGKNVEQLGFETLKMILLIKS